MEAAGRGARGRRRPRAVMYDRASPSQPERSALTAPHNRTPCIGLRPTGQTAVCDQEPKVIVKTEPDVEDSLPEEESTELFHRNQPSNTDEYVEIPLVSIKTEYDSEAETSQEQSTGSAHRQEDSSPDHGLDVKRGYSAKPAVAIKKERDTENAVTSREQNTGLLRSEDHAEGDTDSFVGQDYPDIATVMIKLEPNDEASCSSGSAEAPEVDTDSSHHLEQCRFDVSVVVEKVDEENDAARDLDVKPTPARVARGTSTSDLAEPRAGTSSGATIAPSPFYTVFARPGPRTEVENNYQNTPSQRVTGTSVSTQVGFQCLYSVRSQFENDPRADAAGDCFEYDITAEPDPVRRTRQKTIKRKRFTYGALQSDDNTETRDRGYRCEQCSYSTSHISHLRRHMRTHTRERPYKCQQCEYSASELDSLKRHLRSHTGEKPYECTRCEYTTSHISHLKRHTRIHTGEKPYECHQCGYSASEIGSLKRHVRTHTGEKPYKCDRCKYSASELGSLKRHLRIHTSEKPYKCGQCEYSATQSGNLKIHMRTHNRKKAV